MIDKFSEVARFFGIKISELGNELMNNSVKYIDDNSINQDLLYFCVKNNWDDIHIEGNKSNPKFTVGKDEIGDNYNDINNINQFPAEKYQAKKDTIVDLRKQVAKMVKVAKGEKKAQYANALASEIIYQLNPVEKDSVIWDKEYSTKEQKQVSGGVGNLAMAIVNEIFNDCNSKQEAIDIVNLETFQNGKYFTKAVDVLIEDKAFNKVYINKVIAEDFCEQNGIEFDGYFALDEKNNHFYLKDGRPQDIASDGNCFFHAYDKVQKNLNEYSLFN